MSATSVRIGRVEVSAVAQADAIDEIACLIRQRRGGAVFTPNVDHVVRCERNAQFARAYGRADLRLADGVPLLWAARLFHQPLPEKVSGSDLIDPLMARAARERWRVYLLGSTEEVLSTASTILHARFGVAIVGRDSPRIALDESDDSAALARLQAADPDLVLVALGSPKQELWIDAHRAELAPAVAIAVGASLDFVAGRIPRAPRWMSAAGLEWLFRLLHEPARLWRRYLWDDPLFLALVWRGWRPARRLHS